MFLDFKKKKKKINKPLRKSTFAKTKNYRPKKGTKDYKDYIDFCNLGGNLSGVFDVSDKRTKEFVRKYSKFISSKDVCTRDKNNRLVCYFKSDRK